MLENFFSKIFDYILEFGQPLWDSLIFWRVTSISLALFIAITLKYKDKILAFVNREDQKKHDKSLFEHFDNILSEQKIKDIIDGISDSHVLYRKDSVKIHELLHESQKVGNKFLKNSLEELSSDYFTSLTELISFTAQHFFTKEDFSTNEELRYFLYPDLKYNAKRISFYEEKAKELIPICNKTYECYTKFRKEVKSKLII